MTALDTPDLPTDNLDEMWFIPQVDFSPEDEDLPQTFERWPDLLTELKLDVLSKVLSDYGNPNAHIQLEGHGVVLHDMLYPIVATRNRELVELAMDVYYKRNIFAIYVGIYLNAKGPLFGIRYPRPAKAKLIRRLRVFVKCRVGRTLEDLVRAPDEGWCWLLKPLRPLHSDPLNNKQKVVPEWVSSEPDSETNTQWQLSFSNLKTLEIDFYLQDLVYDEAGRGECCDLGLARQTSLVALVDEAEMLLKADSLEFGYSSYSTKKRGECVGHSNLFQTLQKRATRR
jgi:hypothetical protein